MGEDDASHMAASVSYYAVLSLFPLVLALSAIIGWVAGSESRQDQLIDYIVDNLPGSEQFVRDSVEGIDRFRATLGVVAVLGLIWSASAVFGSITRVVNRAWDVRENPPFYKNKPRQLAMALGVGTLFVVSITSTGVLQWATSIEIDGQTIRSILGGQAFAILLRLPALLISFAIGGSSWPYTNICRIPGLTGVISGPEPCWRECCLNWERTSSYGTWRPLPSSNNSTAT